VDLHKAARLRGDATGWCSDTQPSGSRDAGRHTQASLSRRREHVACWNGCTECTLDAEYIHRIYIVYTTYIRRVQHRCAAGRTPDSGFTSRVVLREATTPV
jgi:hypothetical protein